MKNSIVKNIPNLLTVLRIAATFALLAFPVQSVPFLLLYTFAGLTDVLDGFFARRLHCESELGAVLDSAADLSFYTMMVLRLFPVLWAQVPLWDWVIVFSAVAVRVLIYASSWIRYHRFSSLHTYLNKASGLAVFAIPYFVYFRSAAVYGCVATLVCALATVEEALIHLTSHGYDASRKTLFPLPKKETPHA
ncbi:MAG: CDP-alcohol phosphatidyltransferase family protein [Firmicutes bacterium]|nr:CDP-alcohol phosphatidyltransferase family protein [Bacillota bacterium]